MLHPHDINSDLEPWTIRITELARQLTRRGHQVTLAYSLRDPRKLAWASKLDRYPFRTVPFIRYSFTLLKKIKAITELAREADVVHFQKCFPQAALPAIVAAYRNHLPVHYDWDDWEYQIFQYGAPSRLVGRSIDRFERRLPRLVDTLSVASEGIRRLALELGFPEDRIFPAHVGADLQRFHPDVDGREVREAYGITGPLVLYLGQLSGAQYAELFLEAAERIHARRPDTRFLVVGGGDRLDELKVMAEDMRLLDYLQFTGPLPKPHIPFYLAAADVATAVFVDNEQQRCKSPLKIAEYLAAGKAIVASRVGEVPFMVGDAAILVEPGSADALAEGVLRFLENPDLAREMGRRARKRAEEEFSWEVTARNLELAYCTAIASFRRGRRH
jgi:glycosyltransferase involved in cell wall biosynthesis